MWNTSARAVAPRRLKQIIGKWNEQFAGYDQQDAQELLAFLLNGFNEDLNRVTSKPYAEQPDSNGRPDDEVAEEWWLNTLMREQSIVLLFTGQFKSLLTCGTCGAESARFEPFTTLQLPLPEPSYRFIKVTVVFRHNLRTPVVVSVKVPKEGRISDLKRGVAMLRPGMHITDTPQPAVATLVEELVVCRVGLHSITLLDLPDDTELKTVGDRDSLCAFQVDVVEEAKEAPVIEQGTRVDCKFHGTGQYYPGRVTAVRTVQLPTPPPRAAPEATGDADGGDGAGAGGDDMVATAVADAEAAAAATDGAEAGEDAAAQSATAASTKRRGHMRVGRSVAGGSELAGGAEAGQVVTVYDVVYDDGDVDTGVFAYVGGGMAGVLVTWPWLTAVHWLCLLLLGVCVCVCGRVWLWLCVAVCAHRSALQPRVGPARLSISHRCLLRARTYFLRPFVQSLFCKPFCLRVLPSATTGRELYMMAWRHSKHFIRKSGREEPPLKVNRSPPGAASASSVGDTASTSADAADHGQAPGIGGATGAGGDAGAGAGAGAGGDAASEASSEVSLSSTMSRDELEASTLATYGFVLRHVSTSGMYCSRCPWTKACSGCPIDPDTWKVDVDDGEHVVVDWDPELIDEAYVV